MFQGAGVICTLLIIGISITKCNARFEHKHNQSISCYECNSLYDPRCGDPFDPYTIGIVNCSKKRPLDHLKLEATLCRKTVQKVQGHVRVIRGCGYISDKRDGKECVKRTGTHDVHVLYCSCKNSLCNTASVAHPSSIAAAILWAITRLCRSA